ncbi:MAG: tetratricopeptide repeat protein [Actinomycetota bacterium]|nr:tetratricopeptide repeat protein [Actinomycetota bacterium]
MIKKEFIDKKHEVLDRYYEIATGELDAAKTEEDIREIISDLKELIKEDPTFLDSYNLAADLYRDLDDEKEATKLEKAAYDIALKTITAEKGNWPDQLLWGYLENRHIIRALYRWGLNLWWDGNTEEALSIFRKLLKTNPNDNVGARYSILAIRLGLNPDYDEKWALGPGVDAFKLEEWWNKNYKKFSEEFKEWEEYVESLQ